MKNITTRPETPRDEPFLFELYASTREEELNAWGWPPEIRQPFLQIQFKASQARHLAFPAAAFQMVLLDGAEAGRLILQDTQDCLYLVDIALLPRYRNAGVGTALLQQILATATTARKPVRLQVLQGNRAEQLYRRLGFLPIGHTETHLEMEWRVPTA